MHGDTPSQDRLSGSQGIGGAVEADHDEALACNAAACFAQGLPARRYVDAHIGGKAAFIDSGDDARARRAAVLHARHHLLAHIAALVEIDPVKLVHERLVRESIPEQEVAPAFRHAEADAVSVISLRRGFREFRAILGCNDGAPAELGDAGIIRHEADLVIGLRLVPTCHHRHGLGHVLDHDLGPELVEGQPLGEVGDEDLEGIEVITTADFLRPLEDEKIEHDLALRRQQGTETGGLGRDPVEVAGDEAVEKTLGVLARNPYHASVG